MRRELITNLYLQIALLVWQDCDLLSIWSSMMASKKISKTISEQLGFELDGLFERIKQRTTLLVDEIHNSDYPLVAWHEIEACRDEIYMLLLLCYKWKYDHTIPKDDRSNAIGKQFELNQLLQSLEETVMAKERYEAENNEFTYVNLKLKYPRQRENAPEEWEKMSSSVAQVDTKDTKNRIAEVEYALSQIAVIELKMPQYIDQGKQEEMERNGYPKTVRIK